MSQFARTGMVLGEGAVNALTDAHVAIVGLGGVGGYALEALVRAGIGKLTLIDSDVFEQSNLNRQLLATWDTIGQSKVQVAMQRVKSINPQAQVIGHEAFYLPENADRFDLSDADYICDAIDTMTAKIALILRARKDNVPIISCMGTGNKRDPMAFQVADIYETSVCPMAKAMRKLCRESGIEKLMVVYSKETPRVAQKSQTPGSLPFVPGAAGLLMASKIVYDILSKKGIET